MNAVSPNWQRLALLGVCASAGVFLAGYAWQVVGVLAPVLGLFFGGWLLSCVLEPRIPSLAALVACLGYFRPRWSCPS